MSLGKYTIRLGKYTIRLFIMSLGKKHTHGGDSPLIVMPAAAHPADTARTRRDIYSHTPHDYLLVSRTARADHGADVARASWSCPFRVSPSTRALVPRPLGSSVSPRANHHLYLLYSVYFTKRSTVQANRRPRAHFTLTKTHKTQEAACRGYTLSVSLPRVYTTARRLLQVRSVFHSHKARTGSGMLAQSDQQETCIRASQQLLPPSNSNSFPTPDRKPDEMQTMLARLRHGVRSRRSHPTSSTHSM